MKPLSPREAEALQWVGCGLTNDELATEMAISPHTAKFHVNSVLEKLGCASRVQAVVKALVLGLLKLDELDYPGMADEMPPPAVVEPTLDELRAKVAATGFRVENPPNRTYAPTRRPWQVRLNGSVWGTAPTEMAGLRKALKFAAQRPDAARGAA